MTRSVFGAPLSQGKPIVTITLIAVCVVMFVATQAFGAGRVIDSLGFLPAAAGSEPWRFLSGAFLHLSLIHLAFNMYALWVVGSFLETMLGRWRFACLYFLSALGGAVAILLVAVAGHPEIRTQADLASWFGTTAGASGAVFGLFGAMFLVIRRLKRDAGGIVAIIVLNVIVSFTVRGISWQGHLGGLVVGAALGAIYAYSPQVRRQRRSITGSVLVGAGLIGAAVWMVALSPV